MKLPTSLPIRIHLLIFGLLVLAPTLFIAGLITVRYAHSERSSIENTASDKAHDFALSVDRRLTEMTSALSALATSPSIDAGDYAAFYAQAKSVLPGPDYVIAMRDLKGQQLINTYVIWGTPLPVSSDPILLKTDRKVAETGKPAVSDLYTGAVSKRAFVLVEVPVMRDGAVRYILNMAVQPAVVLSWLPQGANDWLFSLVDSNFVILARSRDHQKYAGQRASAEFVRLVVGPSGTLTSRTLDGVDVFTAYQRLSVSNWVAVVSVPRFTLSEPLQQLWLTLAGLIVTGALASVLAALLYSRLLGRELHALTADAAAVASEQVVPLKSSTIREVDEVHRAISDASTDLAEGRAQQKVLLAELNHRVKNTLAIIQTLIGRTVSDHERPEVVRTTLRGRVAALATAHDALSDAEWRDADLGALVFRLVGAKGGVKVSGPPVLLRPKALVSIAQSVQELLNFSTARGALSRGGAVAIHWSLEASALALTWVDKAPEVPLLEEPDFGATIIRLCIERQLGGGVTATSSGSEARYVFSIPFSTDLGTNIQTSDSELAVASR